LGIAHNDSHGGNIIVDERGFPRFVDFGLSQDNPKAALSEAFGGIVNRTVIPPGAVVQGGIRSDIQASKVRVSGIKDSAAGRPENLNRIYSNLSNVKTHLKKLGMSNDEIAQVMASGIRNPESSYNKGAWGKLTNEEALKVIGMLYDGV
jgi:predicted unusual protein kinase regulating ubiquinone biosynthesis (AarF/ABC1/UbiB family)